MVKTAALGVTVAPVIAGQVDKTGVGAGRLVYLDGIRGYLLTMMYLIHFQAMSQGFGTSFFLAALHHGNLLPVYDAEYLVPLSGFVSALAYSGVYRAGGLWAAQVTVIKRVRSLYIYQIVTGIIVIMLPLLFRTQFGIPKTTPLWQQLGDVLTLVYQPDNVQILVLFMAVMLFIPLAFRALERFGAMYFTAIIMVCWMIGPSGIDVDMSAWITDHIFPWTQYFQLSGFFNPFSWGSLFYAGFLGGWMYKTRPATVKIFDRRVMDRWLVASLAVCGFFSIGRAIDTILNLGSATLFYPSRAMVSLQSFATIGATCFIVFYLLVGKAADTSPSRMSTGLDAVLHFRWFVLLGQNSLFIYSMHVVVLMAMTLWLSAMPRYPSQMLMLALFIAGYATMLITSKLKRRYLPTLP